MPKMKTHSSAKKRFGITGSGKVKFKNANKGHRLMQKPKSAKRKARGTDTMDHGDAQKVLQSYMPYARAKVSSTKKKTGPKKAAAAKAKTTKGAE